MSVYVFWVATYKSISYEDGAQTPEKRCFIHTVLAALAAGAIEKLVKLPNFDPPTAML